MWMWLIILVVLALVVSPILSLMPSKQQRAAARLRTHAAQLGLRVRLGELSAKSAKHGGETLAVYSLPWLNAEDAKLGKQSPWLLVKTKYYHDIHAVGDWDWADASRKADSQWRSAIQHLFSQAEGDPLFDRLQALEWSAQGVQVYWRESGEEQDVERLADLLASLKAFGRDPTQQPAWPRRAS